MLLAPTENGSDIALPGPQAKNSLAAEKITSSRPMPRTVQLACVDQAYIEDLKKRKGPDADQPHRIAYKRLVRT